MTDHEIHCLEKRIQRDIDARYGKKISIHELAKLLCFNSRESMIRLIQLGRFPVEVAREKGLSAGEVKAEEVKNLLIYQYLRSVRQPNKQIKEESK